MSMLLYKQLYPKPSTKIHDSKGFIQLILWHHGSFTYAHLWNYLERFPWSHTTLHFLTISLIPPFTADYSWKIVYYKGQGHGFGSQILGLILIVSVVVAKSLVSLCFSVFIFKIGIITIFISVIVVLCQVICGKFLTTVPGT